MTKKNTPTVLDFAILGLVKNDHLSGYQIRKVFEETAMGNYSSSPGSIYPALKRLQKLGFVEQILNEETDKKQYGITPEGLVVLREWILKPLDLTDIQKRLDELLLRFAFMDGLVNRNDVMLFLDSFAEYLQIHIAELQDYLKNAENEMPFHGKMAVDQGIRSLKATLAWNKNVKNLINKS